MSSLMRSLHPATHIGEELALCMHHWKGIRDVRVEGCRHLEPSAAKFCNAARATTSTAERLYQQTRIDLSCPLWSKVQY